MAMMKLIVLLILGVIALFTRTANGPVVRRYLAFILAGLGAFSWAVVFDLLTSGRSAVTDATLYAHLLLVSALGVLLSLAVLIASFWCRQKLLKLSAILVGAAAMVRCSINILVPY